MRISEHESKNWLEWTVFAVGTLLVLAVVGVLSWEAWRGGAERPALEVTLGQPEAQGDHYAVPVFVDNRGDQAAEDVQLEVTLTGSDGDQERAELEMAFVPQHGRRRGYALFTTNPATGTLSARPLGYQLP